MPEIGIYWPKQANKKLTFIEGNMDSEKYSPILIFTCLDRDSSDSGRYLISTNMSMK